ncbi:SHOCT domain-containing protein [Streptomyces sp. BR123]|uniref:SHOCT domain-containing protein n=1 Tax=Streptomyces sp. BR123 TaxID=2749828 RepID=UPI0015C41AE8|nr:SHOCT domain-containing protein [Streptomyces sp. BR123]NXY96310.1 SHOCT domain-containing protein [Streptomyces sp. BR123]
MFIRPVGPVVHPARRPAGRPLLRGSLARGAYVWDVAPVPAWIPQRGTGAAEEGAASAPPVVAGPAGEPAGAAGAKAEPAGTAPPHASPGGAPGPSAEPAAPETGADLTAHLTQLAALAREGLLTPEEFSAAKSRLLNP